MKPKTKQGWWIVNGSVGYLLIRDIVCCRSTRFKRNVLSGRSHVTVNSFCRGGSIWSMFYPSSCLRIRCTRNYLDFLNLTWISWIAWTRIGLYGTAFLPWLIQVRFVILSPAFLSGLYGTGLRCIGAGKHPRLYLKTAFWLSVHSGVFQKLLIHTNVKLNLRRFNVLFSIECVIFKKHSFCRQKLPKNWEKNLNMQDRGSLRTRIEKHCS